MINLSIEDLSELISSCISEQLKISKVDIHPKSSNQEKEFLTVEEVGILLGLSKTTLWKYRNNGTLTAKKIGSRIYYPKAELSNFLNSAA